jgi:hypothetical protein
MINYISEMYVCWFCKKPSEKYILTEFKELFYECTASCEDCCVLYTDWCLKNSAINVIGYFSYSKILAFKAIL